MKLIIAGGRDFDDYDLLKDRIDFRLNGDYTNLEIVSGTARGADRLGERYAKENNIPIKRFPADWDKYGKSAGYIRNEQMAKYGTMLVAFWDGESRGTKHMIDLAKKYHLPIEIVRYAH